MMNTRLKELMKQCTWQACWPGDPDAGSFDKERFAELLINECAILATAAENSDFWTRPVADLFKEHFGINNIS
jgi:hypothetical protein